MSDLQLPAHLLARTPRNSVAAQLMQSLPASSIPYLSIEGGRFTLKDATGNEKLVGAMSPDRGLYLDVCIVDSNPHVSQEYYGDRPYNKENPEGAICFSDNGVAPSAQAQTPQAATCKSCPQYEWVQGLGRSGGMAKPCKAKQKIAVVVPGFKDNVFLLRVPTTSLKNLGKYVAEVKSIQVPGLGRELDVSDLITRVYFVQGQVGALGFEPHAYVDPETAATGDKAIETKATDILVGKNDKPYTGEIAVPAVTHAPKEQRTLAPPAPFIPAATGVTPGVAALRSEQEEPKKPRGRPKKEPVAEAPATQAPFMTAPATNGTSGAATAPGDDAEDIPNFLKRADASAAPPTAKPAGPSFGMQQAQAAPEDMAARITAILGMKT